MKVVVDINALPCNNGKDCTECAFYSTVDICEMTAALQNFPKYEGTRQRGEWIPINNHGETWEYKCSICGAEVDTDFPNCPYCLADMQKDDRKNAVQGRGEKS